MQNNVAPRSQTLKLNKTIKCRAVSRGSSAPHLEGDGFPREGFHENLHLDVQATCV